MPEVMEKVKQQVPKLRYQSFKDDWKVELLGDLLTFKNGANADKEQYGSGYKFINVLDIIQNDFITHDVILGSVELSEADFKKNEVVYGDILFQRSSETREEVGQANVYLDKKHTAAFGGFVIRGRAKKEYSPEFMNYLLRTDKVRQDITTKSGGSTRYNVGQEVLEGVSVILPTLPEQQKIAAFLGAVDRKIQQLKRKQALLEQYKKGVVQQLFPSAGSGQAPELRFKREDGSEYPEWEEKRLGDICSNVSYGMNAAAVEYDGENKYLRITDIDENSREFLQTALTSPGNELDDKYLLREGDLLFARTGASVGKSYIYKKTDGKVYFAGFLIRFRIEHGVPEFIYAQTRTKEYDRWVTENSMRSGQPGLNAEEYKSFVVQFPSLEEQSRIAGFLMALDAKVAGVARAVSAAQKWKRGLLQQMFV